MQRFQPLIAKQILPWFGGSAAVWITCVVFFQVALLAGYAYADVVVRKLADRMQFRVHAALLVVSAFFGDAIPVHLVTSEALTAYQRHVKPGGIIAFNVTNRFVDIAPVIARLAEVHKLHAIVVEDRNEKPPSYASDWVLLSDRPESLNRPRLNEAGRRLEPGPDTKLWTDNFNNILQVIR